MVIDMNTVTISEDLLVALRNKFRDDDLFRVGNKQKLSHLDNLFALAIGYSNGYGNLVAAVRAGRYLFHPNNVDTMTLARYEAANIKCACGVEVYLRLYADMGVKPYAVMDFCRTYLAFKVVFAIWTELTDPLGWQRQADYVHGMIYPIHLQPTDKQRFQFLPNFGIWPRRELSGIGLSGLELNCHQEKAAEIYKQVVEAERQSTVYTIDPMEVYRPHVRNILKDVTIQVLATQLLSRLEEVYWHSHVFDVRAYCLWFFHALDGYYVDTPVRDDGAEQCLYLCDDTLVLQEGNEWNAVVLRPEDAEQIRTSFEQHGPGEVTAKMMFQLWAENKKATSATWSEQLNWRDTLQHIKKAFLEDHFKPSENNLNYSPGFIESMFPAKAH